MERSRAAFQEFGGGYLKSVWLLGVASFEGELGSEEGNM